MKSKNPIFSIFLIVYIFMAGATVASAQSAQVAASDWNRMEVVSSRLVSAVTGTGGADSVLLGLQLKLDKGWKTYWRTPGDSGIPPRFNWQGSTNVKRVTVMWPTPMAFDSGGFLSWGYEDEVIFPMKVELKEPGKPLSLKLTVGFGVCEDACIPLQESFALDLPDTAASPSLNAAALERAVAQIPRPVNETPQIDAISMTAQPDNTLEFTAVSSGEFKDPVLILEGEDGDYFNVQGVSISADHKTVRFSVIAEVVRKSPTLKGRVLFATLFDDAFAAEDIVVIK
jgi:DsbC/DsbD-like thiol-disulfide interchange protein